MENQIEELKMLFETLADLIAMENEERSEAIKAGQARALGSGKSVGRPRLIFDRAEVVKLRKEGLSWSQITSRLGVSIGTARRAYQDLTVEPVS